MHDDTRNTPMDSDGALQASDTRALVHVTITIDDGKQKKTLDFNADPFTMELENTHIPDPGYGIYPINHPLFAASIRNMPRKRRLAFNAVAISEEDGTYMRVTMDPPPAHT